MDEYPRRRRLQPQEPKSGGGLPIFPLIVLVVFAGLLLGGLLAKLFGGGIGASTPTPLPSFTPLPSAQPTATFAPRATPRSASPLASASSSPTASGKPSSTPSSAPSPSTASSATPSARPSVFYITPAPKTPASAAATNAPSPAGTATETATATAAPTQVLITGSATSEHAVAIVRAYVGAVARGDESTAAGYLSRGLPNETFLRGASTITDLSSTRNSDGTFTVTASISAPSGSYYETFTLQQGPYGMQITEHSASKAQ